MMYKKIKYFAYAFLFIAIFLVIMDAQNRYSKIEEKKNQEKILQQISDDNKKRSLSQNENQQSNVETQPKAEETQNAQIDSTMNQNKTNESNELPNTESKDEATNQTPLKTTLTLADGMDATGYDIVAEFSLEKIDYVVISHADKKYSSSYSKFANRQYYVYKVTNGKLQRIYYLFERSDKKENYIAEKMNISINKFETTFSYNSKPPLVRKISNSVLKNNSSLYKNTESLFLKKENIEQDEDYDKDKGEDDDCEAEETTNDDLK